jgi:diguanylate cyclase (GGDEF)-like protein/PAS domain S-box-containing protein
VLQPLRILRADEKETLLRAVTEASATSADREPTTRELWDREHPNQTIIDQAPIGIVTIDAHGEIVNTNQAFQSMLGYDEDELRSIPFFSLALPSSAGQNEDRWGQFHRLVSGEIDEMNIEADYVHKNGSTIWARLSLSTVRDEATRLLYAVSMVLDITAQRKLEQRQQLLMEASAALSSSLDFETTLQQVAHLSVKVLADLCVVSLIDGNGAIQRVAAVHANPRLQVIADALKDGSPLVSDEAIGVSAALRTGQTQLYEDFPSATLGGMQQTTGLSVYNALNIRSMLIVPLIAKNATIGTISFAYAGTTRSYSLEDINIAEDLARRAAVAIDNARLHKEAREAENRFRSLVENMPAMVYVSSAGDLSHLTYQSPMAARTMGYSDEEWQSDPRFWFTRIHPADRSTVIAESTQSIDNQVSMEYRSVTRDGGAIWVRNDASLIHDDDGQPMFWLGVCFDVSEQKQAERRLRTSEQHFRSLIQHAADVIGVLDATGIIRFQSPASRLVLGFHPEEMTGTHFSTYVHPDEEPMIERFLHDVIANPGRHLPLTYRCRHKDGSWRWLEATITNLLSDPSIRGVVINARDITERMLAEQATRESQARFLSAFHDAAVGMAIIGLDRQLIQVNPAFCAMTGYSEAELLTMTDAHISHPEDINVGGEFAQQVVQGSINTFQIEKRYLSRSGITIWCLVNIAAVRDESGAPLYLLAQAQDISERKELESQLSHQALHDSLTGLPNRTLMLDRLDREVSNARRHEGCVAVLFLDLDNFKIINDSLGHATGDTLLITVAQRLLECVREQDTVARFGGDEFVVIIGQINGVEEAVDVAKRIMATMEEPFHVSGRPIVITPSIGIAISEAGQHHRNDLLRHADIAMYRAKANGRAGYDLFDAAMHDAALERLELEHDLRRALERDEFFLVYQPVLSVASGSVVGMEALIRWQHPARGVISPAEFISTAEETGLIVPIGEWVLREACEQAALWARLNRHGANLRIGVNLSGRQFQQMDLTQVVESALIESDLTPKRLILELTEGVVMEHVDETAERLRELTALGIRIAIDDFGTGYSSLAYLQQFPVSVLKIDQSFVQRIGKEQDGTPIVSATIGLAKTLGLTIVAEGIETAEQLQVLRDMKCDQVQGNYLARPLSPEEIAAWLRNNTG